MSERNPLAADLEAALNSAMEDELYLYNKSQHDSERRMLSSERTATYREILGWLEDWTKRNEGSIGASVESEARNA